MNLENSVKHGYQIIEELGHNLSGGRVTYKATHIPTGETVVIKQFQFLGNSWTETEYDAYEQEINVLRHLSHPGIPRYLDNFETDEGFCLVQQYLDAQSLAIPRQWKLEEIKHIALSVLKILAYLHSQSSPVIHRDIKPENILIDSQLKVYLIDFGFARVGGGEIGVSSVVKGTMGFMPPEQLFNRQLTPVSDLYGLGATLVCLLTGVKSVDIGTLVDADYKLHFRHLVPPMQRGWITWLEKMVQPLPQDRFSSAKEALSTLKPIDVHQLPKVRLTQEKFLFQTTGWPETQSQTITIINPIPNTILSGRWEVAPHPSDPPHTPYDHSWIWVSPQKFEGNKTECQITVDTTQLLPEKTYQRQLILHTNTLEETQFILLKIETGSLPQLQKPEYVSLSLLFIFCCCAGIILMAISDYSWWILVFGLPGVAVIDALLSTTAPELKENPSIAIMAGVLGSVIAAIVCSMFLGAFFFSGHSGIGIGIILAMAGILGGVRLGISRYKELQQQENYRTLMGKIVLAIMFFPYCLTSLAIAILLPGVFLPIANLQKNRGIELLDSRMITLLTGGLGISIGIWVATLVGGNLINLQISVGVVWMLMMAIASGGTLVYLWYKKAIAIPRKHNQTLAYYQASKTKLIQS